MDITPEMIVGVVVLTLLGLLLTGPGMWSERWGWGWLQRKRTPQNKAQDREAPRAPERPGPRS